MLCILLLCIIFVVCVVCSDYICYGLLYIYWILSVFIERILDIDNTRK